MLKMRKIKLKSLREVLITKKSRFYFILTPKNALSVQKLCFPVNQTPKFDFISQKTCFPLISGQQMRLGIKIVFLANLNQIMTISCEFNHRNYVF